jgi:hypothetical protein
MTISPLGQSGPSFGQSFSPGGWTPLILDTFVFDDAQLETPEAFGDMGGTQSLEQHDFPGGTRTHKAYGYFPAQQKWRAKFHGQAASDRAEGVKRILAAGKEVKLQYGTHSWLGRVARFSPTARHNWLYDYELEFWPRLDFGSPGPTLPPPTDLGTMLSLHLLALQSLIKYGLDPQFIGQAAAIAIGGPVGFLISQTLDAVSAAGGNINQISASNQQQNQLASIAAMTAVAPYQLSPNPVLSSPANDAASRITAIQNLMTAAQPAVATIQTINPNLVTLSAQYYGDASRWRSIAAANGLADPQPIGSYNLVIPQAA